MTQLQSHLGKEIISQGRSGEPAVVKSFGQSGNVEVCCENYFLQRETGKMVGSKHKVSLFLCVKNILKICVISLLIHSSALLCAVRS